MKQPSSIERERHEAAAVHDEIVVAVGASRRVPVVRMVGDCDGNPKQGVPLNVDDPSLKHHDSLWVDRGGEATLDRVAAGIEERGRSSETRHGVEAEGWGDEYGIRGLAKRTPQ